MDQVCYGIDLRNYDVELLRKSKKINLQWIIELYKASPNKEQFFDSKLSNQMGLSNCVSAPVFSANRSLTAKSEEEIRASWEPGLSEYKKMRKKYLLYP
jgi:hypothetical protein